MASKAEVRSLFIISDFLFDGYSQEIACSDARRDSKIQVYLILELHLNDECFPEMVKNVI